MPYITTNLDLALNDFYKGKPVAIPTETVYGLAAPISNETAIKAVFAMKKRPLDHPLIVHVGLGWDLDFLASEIPFYAKRLIKEFWPGPLTLVFSCKHKQINPLITAGQSTIAIRCPDHPLTQDLLKHLKIPLVAPSANPFGKVSPTTAQHVSESFPDQELIILDGGRCSVGIESTIVDATHLEHYQILRHGQIDEKNIEEVIDLPSVHRENPTKVPGRLERHYQPQKILYYFDSSEALESFCQQNKESIYVIARKCPSEVEENHFHLLGNNPEEVAFDLYYQLRKADASNAQIIVIELPPSLQQWQGVRERILKAGIPCSG